MFRRKGHSKEKFICLELKHAQNPRSCVTQMFKDWNKVGNTRKETYKI